MVLLRRCVIGLLLLVVAGQLVTGIRAWKDDAVATSWMKALANENTCWRSFTPDEARHFEHLATVKSSELTETERSQTDCYLRDKDRRRSLERVTIESAAAKDAMRDAAVLGALATVIVIFVAAMGRLRRSRAAKAERGIHDD